MTQKWPTRNPLDTFMSQPPRTYLVGKYKDYRKLVGLGQVKNHVDPELNMSQKRRKTMSISNAPPTQRLSLIKPNRKGAQISEAVNEIIFNLERYDKKLESTYEGMYQPEMHRPKQMMSKTTTNNKHKRNITTFTARNEFFPKIAKQKVLDKFIDLSTADVFN